MTDEVKEETELQDVQQPNEPVDQEEQKEVGEMKRGDYMIHVFLEKGKEFMVEGEDTVDPIVEVSCLRHRRYSSAKKKITKLAEVHWNEHMFLEPRNVEKQDAEEGSIVINVITKSLLRNSLVGTFKFDLSFIYFKENHTMLHQWVALSNPDQDDFKQITGYLKLSISVIAAGDTQLEITEDNSTKNDDSVMMPPQLNPKFYQLKFRFF
jgi:dihydroxyacetone kinase-like predicted kinase